MILRWALRELRGSWKFCLFFILNLSLGFLGFLTLDSFKSSLSRSLQENAKSFLSADIAVSSRQRITPELLKTIQNELPQNFQEGHLWEFFSMVSHGQQTRLVQVKGIDATYPFYGELKLKTGQHLVSGTDKDIHTGLRAWVYPELLAQLGVQLGDKITIGDKEFEITDVVEDDSTQTFRLSSLAPKIYVGFNQLQNSSLVSFGTTLSDVYLYKFDEQTNAANAIGGLAELEKKILSKVEDPAVQVTTPEKAGESSARALNNLMDYLGLVSLVALFLAVLGSVYLFRNFIFLRLKSIAVYRVLGLTSQQLRWVYLSQLVILGVAASIVSYGLSWFIFPLLQNLLVELSPIAVTVTLSWKSFLIAVILGPLGTVFVGLPFLSALTQLNISYLFQEAVGLRLRIDWKNWLWLLPAIVSYWVLAIWQANSVRVGSIFVASLLAALLILTVLSFFGLQFFSRPIFTQSKNWIVRHAILTITRNKITSLAVIVSLGLGSLLINVIPQLRAGLKEELEAPDRLTLPSVFLFDIQEEQLEPLREFLKKENVEIKNISPLVRARIISVNGETFERNVDASQFRTREEENEARFRNRGFNLSYRDGILESETLTQGELVSGAYDANSGKLPGISVEERFADRLGFKLGDKLKFDIQGIEVEGEIRNFRKVRWNSFQPNFFISFQPGVLDDAPKTYLAAIPKMPGQDVGALQNKIVKDFSNVSMVDVARTVNKIFEMSEKMSWALLLMAVLSVFTGLVVTYSIANQQAQLRRWDVNMMKILGSGFKELSLLTAIEFGVLATVSSVLGVLLSVLMSYSLSLYVFEGKFTISIWEPLVTMICIVTMTVAVAILTGIRVFREKPLSLLQSLR